MKLNEVNFTTSVNIKQNTTILSLSLIRQKRSKHAHIFN